MKKTDKKLTVKCPTCQKPTAWHENVFRPFCSERCKMIDLGNWADGKYNVESIDAPDFPEDDHNGLSGQS